MPSSSPPSHHALSPQAARTQRQQQALRALLWCFVPLLGWVLVTMAIALVQPWVAFERQLAPGESLAWQGLAISAGVTMVVALRLRRAAQDALLRKVVTGVAVVGGLMAWPVVTLGPLPSINGMWLSHGRTTPMGLERLSASPQKRQREPYYWAHLQPLAGTDSSLPAGPLLIEEAQHTAWRAQGVQRLQVMHQRGLLGARVVTHMAP